MYIERRQADRDTVKNTAKTSVQGLCDRGGIREIGGKKELSESIDIFAKAVPLIIVELEEGEKSLQGMVEQVKDFLMKMPDFKNDGQEYLS